MPVYNGNATTSTNYQNVNVVLNDANCPYYQLYGPPPSYETVIAQTRGKISNPASSPDSTNAQATMQPSMQSAAGVAANSSVPQCFSYACNSSARLSNATDQEAQYRHGTGAPPRQLDNPECVPLPHFPQYCLGMDGPIGQNVCVPFTYQERPPAFVPEDSFNRIYQATSTSYVPYPMDKPSDPPDPENPSYELSKRYSTMVNIDCTAGSSKDESVWKRSDRSISKIHAGNKTERGSSEKVEENRGQTRESRSETEASFSSAFNTEDSNRTNDSKSTVDSPEDFESEYAKSDRVYGGSLRAIGRYAGQAKRKEYAAENALSKIMPHSCDGLINTEPAATSDAGASRRDAGSSRVSNTVNVSANSFQSNPSNNVILARFDANGSSSSTENLENEAGRSRLVNTSTSTNSDLESNHRLDRSKSLD